MKLYQIPVCTGSLGLSAETGVLRMPETPSYCRAFALSIAKDGGHMGVVLSAGTDAGTSTLGGIVPGLETSDPYAGFVNAQDPEAARVTSTTLLHLRKEESVVAERGVLNRSMAIRTVPSRTAVLVTGGEWAPIGTLDFAGAIQRAKVSFLPLGQEALIIAEIEAGKFAYLVGTTWLAPQKATEVGKAHGVTVWPGLRIGSDRVSSYTSTRFIGLSANKRAKAELALGAEAFEGLLPHEAAALVAAWEVGQAPAFFVGTALVLDGASVALQGGQPLRTPAEAAALGVTRVKGDTKSSTAAPAGAGRAPLTGLQKKKDA